MSTPEPESAAIEREKIRAADRANQRENNAKIAQAAIVGIPAIITAAVGSWLGYMTYLNGLALESAKKQREDDLQSIVEKLDTHQREVKGALDKAKNSVEEKVQELREDTMGKP